jgi:hypothetical protein
MFREEDERRMVELVEARGPVRYEAVLDGERKTLNVRVVGVSPHGFAFFEGCGEPELVTPRRPG